MNATKTLSKGDVHLLISGVFFATFILVRMTDPADYGMTLHPKLDRTWTMWRMLISAGWMVVALAIATLRRGDALARSLSYAAATATALGLFTLMTLSPESASWFALFGSLAVYAGTSGVLCLKVQRPIPAALLGGLFFLVQISVDAVVHFLTGSFRIH